MGEVLFYGCLTFFSAYGIVSFLFFWKDFLLEKKYLRGKCLYSLVFLKEDAYRAEGLAKALLFKVFKNDCGLCDRKVILVDQGSKDGTFSALFNLFLNERDVLVLKEEEISKKLEDL